MTTRRPRHTRTDANQKTILAEVNQVPAFRAWNISRLSDRECPGDILVLHVPTRRWQPFEIKTLTGKASEAQDEMSEFVPIARCAEDVFNFKWLGRL